MAGLQINWNTPNYTTQGANWSRKPTRRIGIDPIEWRRGEWAQRPILPGRRRRITRRQERREKFLETGGDLIKDIYQRGAGFLEGTPWEGRLAPGWLPAQGEYTEAKDYLRGIPDTISPLSKTQMGAIGRGEMGIGGKYYGGYEKSALSGLQDIAQSGGIQDVDIRRFGEALRTAQTPKSALERALESRYTAAAEGGLTPESAALYERLAAPLDIAAADEQKRLREELGGQYSLYGGRRADLMSRLAEKTAAQKEAIMADLMQKDTAAATDYALQNRQMQTQLAQVAGDLAAKTGMNKIQANEVISQHVREAGRQLLDNAKLQLEEGFKNIDNQFKKAGMMMDSTKWRNEYDLAQRKYITDFIQNLIKDATTMGQGDIERIKFTTPYGY